MDIVIFNSSKIREVEQALLNSGLSFDDVVVRPIIFSNFELEKIQVSSIEFKRGVIDNYDVELNINSYIIENGAQYGLVTSRQKMWSLESTIENCLILDLFVIYRKI